MRWRTKLRGRWDLSAIVALVAFIGGAASILAATGMYEVWRGAPGADLWQEIAWPFGRDAWPAGRAFRCTGTICGSGIELYVRPKIGFCNCATGVADDYEVDRVTDLDLITPRFAPLRDGIPVRVADMAGRARDYTLQLPDGAARQAIGIAVSRGCDVIVAAVQGQAAAAPDVLSSALDLLSSGAVMMWLNAILGGGPAQTQG